MSSAVLSRTPLHNMRASHGGLKHKSCPLVGEPIPYRAVDIGGQFACLCTMCYQRRKDHLGMINVEMYTSEQSVIGVNFLGSKHSIQACGIMQQPPLEHLLPKTC